jgi:starvation-inducible DNA-binding protein
MTHRTQNDLPEGVRVEMIKLLNQRLADAIDLYAQAKQAHWNVKGPHFIALHELFDQVASAVQAGVDEIAERAVALGGTADGTLPSVVKHSSLPPYPVEATAGSDHLERLSTSVATYGRNLRAAIDQADTAGDADTADLFTGISREVDKQLWFIEAHLQGRP